MKNFFFAALTLISLLSESSLIAENRFKVGVVAPLSGGLAEYGLAAQNGIKIAEQDYPEIFKNIDFIYEDSQWDPKFAVAAFNKLKDQDKVSLIFNWGNPTTEAIAPLAERYKFPLLGMSTNPSVTKNRKFVIRSTNQISDFSEILSKYLQEQKFKNIGVVIVENSYVQGLYEGLQKSLNGKVSIEIVDQHSMQTLDFKSTISKIRTKKYDAVGVFLITGQISTFYKQMAEQGMNVPTFGTDFFESSTEIKNAAGHMDGSVYPHLGVSDSFYSKYVSKYNNDYQIAYAGNAHDIAIVIGKLFNSGIAPGADEIITRLSSVSNEQGVGGIFSYSTLPDNDPHYEFPVRVKRISGNKIVVLD